MHTTHVAVKRTEDNKWHIHQSLSTLFCLDKVSKDGHLEMAPWLRDLTVLPKDQDSIPSMRMVELTATCLYLQFQGVLCPLLASAQSWHENDEDKQHGCT